VKQGILSSEWPPLWPPEDRFISGGSHFETPWHELPIETTTLV
jgi:hypothetical protein